MFCCAGVHLADRAGINPCCEWIEQWQGRDILHCKQPLADFLLCEHLKVREVMFVINIVEGDKGRMLGIKLSGRS